MRTGGYLHLTYADNRYLEKSAGQTGYARHLCPAISQAKERDEIAGHVGLLQCTSAVQCPMANNQSKATMAAPQARPQSTLNNESTPPQMPIVSWNQATRPEKHRKNPVIAVLTLREGTAFRSTSWLHSLRSGNDEATYIQ
jgi:hypothetical protein